MQSPNASLLGDGYYSLENGIKLSKAQDETLTSFATKIKGTWTGRLTETVCKGSDLNPRKEVEHFKYKAEITLPSISYLKLSIDNKGIKSGVIKKNHIYLLGKKSIFALKTLRKSVSFTEKYRQTPGNQESRLVENIATISTQDKKLIINMYYFLNRVFSHHQEIALTQ